MESWSMVALRPPNHKGFMIESYGKTYWSFRRFVDTTPGIGEWFVCVGHVGGGVVSGRPYLVMLTSMP